MKQGLAYSWANLIVGCDENVNKCQKYFHSTDTMSNELDFDTGQS